MAALLANATRQLRGAWPLRYSALATDQSYRLTKMESGDVGYAATSAKRRLAGNVPGMTALVVRRYGLGSLAHRAGSAVACGSAWMPWCAWQLWHSPATATRFAFT